MVSNVYPDHRYFFLESGNSDNDLQLGVIQQLCEWKTNFLALRSPRNIPEQVQKLFSRHEGKIELFGIIVHLSYSLGFQKGKSAEN